MMYVWEIFELAEKIHSEIKIIASKEGQRLAANKDLSRAIRELKLEAISGQISLT